MESEKSQDIWTKWLLEKRHGGDAETQKTMLEFLGKVKDKILENAAIENGMTVLDAGAGDGLIAFAALDHVGAQGRVIFNEISQDLLDHCQALADKAGVIERCRFINASVDNLAGVDDSSVDVVTVRSVLIFVKDKQAAFREFHRILRKGGRLSMFEPINRFGYHPENIFGGYNVEPVIDIVKKVSAVYSRIQPADTDPMLDFDERDLFSQIENAGFGEIHLELQAELAAIPPVKWKNMLRIVPNPRVPALEDAMRQALTDEEIEKLTQHLRPLVEAGQGVMKRAASYTWAKKLE